MEGNESEQQKKHETGFDEKENLELSSPVATNDSHNEENVICKLTNLQHNNKN